MAEIFFEKLELTKSRIGPKCLEIPVLLLFYFLAMMYTSSGCIPGRSQTENPRGVEQPW
jgi:hypothetical protein